MRRRRTAAIAGTAALTAFAATLGLGANLGLFGLTEPSSRVGHLDTTRAPAAAPTSVTGASPVDVVEVARIVTSRTERTPDD
jgi:hypothetical protein